METPSSLLVELNQLLADCKSIFPNLIFIQRDEDDAAELNSQIQGTKLQTTTLSEGFSISRDSQKGKLSLITYTVIRHVLIPGCYRTKNGDGWPDEIDLVDMVSFDTVSKAFQFLMLEWFKQNMANCLESAAE